MPSPIGTIAKQTGIIRLLTVDFSVWWGPIAARTVKYRCVHSWAQTPSKWFPDSGGRKFSRSPRNSIKGGEYRKEAEPTGILSLQRPDTSIPQPRINLCNMRSFRGKGFERSASAVKLRWDRFAHLKCLMRCWHSARLVCTELFWNIRLFSNILTIFICLFLYSFFFINTLKQHLTFNKSHNWVTVGFLCFCWRTITTAPFDDRALRSLTTSQI